MSGPPAQFKRMLLGLPRSASDYAAVRAAAELAETLRVDLSGAFIEDPSLLMLAQHRGVRELQAFGAGWRTLEPAQMMRDLQQAAGAAERLFVEAIKACRIEAKFDILRSATSDPFGSLAQRGDILAIVEPKNPAERITRQFTGLLEAALRQPAPVMVVPGKIARTHGPIVAIARGQDDLSVETAVRLAELMNEQVVVLNAAEPATRDAPKAKRPEVPGGHGLRIEGNEGDVAAVLESKLKGRLLVFTRFDDSLTLQAVPRCRVPVLMMPDFVDRPND